MENVNVFFVILATLVCFIYGEDTSNNCPTEQLEQCRLNPCYKKECSSNTELTCRPDYCECSVKWYLDSGEERQCEVVGEKGSLIAMTPNCPRKQRVKCFINPCSKKSCLSKPDLTCRPNYCGGCNARWFTPSGEEEQCEETTKKFTPVERSCPLNQIVKCFMDPCKYLMCTSELNLECRSDYCGACSARWFTASGEEKQCEQSFREEEYLEPNPTCPRDPRKKCMWNPCYAKTCMSNTNLTCRPDVCGCDSQWYLPNGEEEHCESVSVRMYRSENGPLCPIEKSVRCLIDPCLGTKCLSSPDLQCRLDTCGGCNIRWYNTSSGEEEGCEDVAKDALLETVSNCPREKLVRCLANPCRMKTCLSHPELECRPCHCGVCKAKWYSQAGEEIQCTEVGNLSN